MDTKKWITGLLVIGVLLVAIGFRFYNIKQYPPGLFPDQAANGEDAELILHGDWRPFYPRGNGREALFFYLEAAMVKLYGVGVWPMFASSAIIGTLTVLATYFAARVWFGRLAGLLASFFLATNAWHVTISRTGFRAIQIPLFLALFTALVGYLIKAVHKGQKVRAYIYAGLVGIVYAGGFYTYIAYRAMIGVVLGMLFFLLLAALHPKIGFPHVRRYWRHTVIAIIAGLITIAPLAIYFMHHPGALVGRAGQVSVFNPDLQRQFGGGKLLPTVLYVTRETLLSFFVGQGDLNWRQNVAGFPLLNPLVGLLFLLGLAWAIHGLVMVIYKIFRGQELHQSMIHPYLLLLLLGMLLPVITTAEGIPHGLRSIGLVTPIFILAGAAGSVCVYWLKRQYRWPASLRATLVGLLAGLTGLGAIYDGTLYFVFAPQSPDAYAAYRGDLTEVAQFINQYHQQHADKPRPYVVLDKFSIQTIHFLTTVAAHDDVGNAVHPDDKLHKWVQVDPEKSQTINLDTDEIMIFTQSTMVDADRYAAQHSEVEVLESRRNKWNQEIMRVYRVKPIIPASPESSLDAE